MHYERAGGLLIRAQEAHRAVIEDPIRGRPVAEAVVADARAARDREALVSALRSAGWAARELYDHEAALRHLGEAARVARRAGLADRLCETLIVRSAALLEVGRAAQARRDLAEARDVANHGALPEVLLAEALMEDKAGNFTAAADANRRVLAVLDGEQPELRVKALNNLALQIVRDGQYAEAESLLAEAFDLAKTFSATFAGFVAESRAIVAIASGRPVLALRRYDDAEVRLQAVQAQLVDLYLGKANALLTLRLLDEAAEAAARAVAQVDGVVGGSLMLAEALLPQARIALARDDVREARTVAARAEELFRQQRRPGWRAAAALVRLSAEVRSGEASPTMLRNLRRLERTMEEIHNRLGTVEAALLYGDVAARLGKRSAAIAGLGRATASARGGTILLRMHGHHAAARRAELQGNARRLGQICRRGLDDVAAYQASFASTELRARAATHGVVLADIGLRAALRSGRPEQVWNWIERKHAMVFVRGPRQRDDRLDALLTTLRSSELQLRELAPDAARERAEVIRRIKALERRIRNLSWTRTGGHHEWTSPSVQAMRDLRQRLGDRVLLQYGTLDGDLIAVSVTSRGFRTRRIGRLDDLRTANRHLGFALRRLGRPRSASATRAAIASAREVLDRLRVQLIAPFGDLVARADEVVVAAQGDLIGVPWAVLGAMATRPVRVLPSATAWLRSSQQRPRSDRVLLVAGPDVPEADAEVATIARSHAQPEVLTGAAATCGEIRRSAGGARVVHLATHGVLRADNPTFSSVQLADGPLTVYDFDDLEQPAHHWILAACDLGHPGAPVGPALEGVLAAILSRGAGAVVAAAVSVPDLSTRRLMVELHRCLAEGRDPALALVRARTALDPEDASDFATATAFACYGGG